MESRYHHSRARRTRKGQTTKQKCNYALKSNHWKRWNGSWKRKMSNDSNKFYYNKHLKPALVKLHKRGYNLLGYPYDSGKQDTAMELSNGSKHLFNLYDLYVKNDVEKILIMGFLLTFMFHKHLHAVHQWNTDLLTRMAAVIVILPLAQLVLSKYIISERLMQTMLLHSLIAQPASYILRLGSTTAKTPTNCRQQYVQGYKHDSLNVRLHQWFSNLLTAKHDCSKTLAVKMPQSKPTNRKGSNRKPRSYYFTLQKHLRHGKPKKQEDIFRYHIGAQFANITTYPTSNDLSGFCKELESQACPNEMELLKFEWKRFITFKDCTQHINGVRLARNGFYFAGSQDDPSLTRCYSCHLENSSWDYFSNVEEFHRRHSPTCSHIASMNATSPADGTQQATTQSSESTYPSVDFAQAVAAGAIPKTSMTNQSLKKARENNSSTNRTLQDLPSSLSRVDQDEDQFSATSMLITSPRIQEGHNSMPMTYPDYQSLVARKQSFLVNNWPYQIDPSPKAMAEAGFFYAGDADKVICFYCGICCGEWNNGENAWMEHAVANINCPLLKQFKDSTFFDGARQEISWRQNESSRPKSGSIVTVPVQDVDPMATYTAKVILETKVCTNQMQIIQAVQHVWRTKGSLTDDPEMAMNWILDEQSREEELPSNSGMNFIREDKSQGTITSFAVVVTSAILTTTVTSSQVHCNQAATAATVTATVATSNNRPIRAMTVINESTVINTTAPPGEDETALKELEQTSISRHPMFGDVERTTVVCLTSQNQTNTGPIYSMAGQRADIDHEVKMAKVASKLVKIGFTFEEVTKELIWMQHMKDTSVEDIVQMADISINGKRTQTCTSEADLLEGTEMQAVTITTPVSQPCSSEVSTEQTQCLVLRADIQHTDKNETQPACSVVESTSVIAPDMLPSQSDNALIESASALKENCQGLNLPNEQEVEETETILCDNGIAVDQVAAGGDSHSIGNDTPAQMADDHQKMSDQQGETGDEVFVFGQYIPDDQCIPENQCIPDDQCITDEQGMSHEQLLMTGDEGNVGNEIAAVDKAAEEGSRPKDEVINSQRNVDYETHTLAQNAPLQDNITGAIGPYSAPEGTISQGNRITDLEDGTDMEVTTGKEAATCFEGATGVEGAVGIEVGTGGPSDKLDLYKESTQAAQSVVSENQDVELKTKSKKKKRRKKRTEKAQVDLQPGPARYISSDQQEPKAQAAAISAEQAKAIGDMMMQISGFKESFAKVEKTVVKVTEENEQLKERTICKICMDRDVTVTFRPCGHLATCDECSRKVEECPICRKKIKKRENTFIP